MSTATDKQPKDRIKNRRDIGQVITPMEKMAAARQLSSCCVGVEAVLEPRSRFGGILDRVSSRGPAWRTTYS